MVEDTRACSNSKRQATARHLRALLAPDPRLLRIDAVHLNRVTRDSPGDCNNHGSLVGLAVSLEGVGSQLIPGRVQLYDSSIRRPDRKGCGTFLRSASVLWGLAVRGIWTTIFALPGAGCIDKFPCPTFRKAQRGSD